MELDLRLFEVFCHVYEQKSFSRAADRILLSQPTVSGHIKKLEDDLGIKLFDRLPRRIVPTASGRLLYRHGKSILKQREAAIQELQQLLNRVEGILRIDGSTIPGEYLLLPMLTSYQKSHPGVQIDLRISDSQDACLQVLNEKVELAFVGSKVEMVGLVFHRFASDILTLVVPDNQDWRGISSISLEELFTKPFISREIGSGTRRAFEKKIRRRMDDFNVVATLGSTNAIKQAVRAGFGISVISQVAVNAELQSGVLKAVSIEGLEDIRRDFFLVVNQNLSLSPISRSFLEHVLGAAETKSTDQILMLL